MLKEFQLLASTSYPTEKWINLGVYEAQPRLGERNVMVDDDDDDVSLTKITTYGLQNLSPY
jgi:hypothetical protein